MRPFKPMLAAQKSCHEWPEDLRLPVLASPKVDGIRCIILNGKAVTRSLKPIPNRFIREELEKAAPWMDGLDGELVAGEVTDPDVYRNTSSVVMSKEKEPDLQVRFVVFDSILKPELPFHERLEIARDTVSGPDRVDIGISVQMVPHRLLHSWDEVTALEELYLEEGLEGVILRCPYSPYKYGRSTVKEQGMVKLKRFIDDEAVIIGFEQLMRNNNSAYTNELGGTARSTSRDGLVPGGTLGAFIVKSAQGTFNIGTFKGLTASDKQEIWNNREEYYGKIVKFSHFPIGVKDVPRHPKFIGFRDPSDT